MHSRLWNYLALLTTCLLLAVTAHALEASRTKPTSIKVVMGDGTVSGERIKAYDLTWSQCSFQDGKWIPSSPFREAIVINNDKSISLVQTTEDVNGTRSVATHKLFRKSLSRDSLKRKISDANGNLLGETSTVFTPKGSTTTITQGGKTARKTSKINSTMFSGMFLGLPLSTLDYSKGNYIMDTSMISFQATYRIEATHVGSETLKIADQLIVTDLVDVRWLHHESGDIYPAGPNASGGRYWLIRNPPIGVPYVIAYKTDTYAIEFLPMTCA